jgi:S-adenosylmethionine:tRNA ribosyltransferase-isomerase
VEVPEYDLPDEAIAQSPNPRRDSARLLDATSESGRIVHRRVHELPELLREGDVLVVNDSRVIPARLSLYKATGGCAEVLLLEPVGDGAREWMALVKPGRRLPPGTALGLTPSGEAVIEVGERCDDGVRLVRFRRDVDLVMGAHGALALPPYIHKPLAEPGRYQTVYADRPGSVAAPTAGLHLTPEVLTRCAERGVEVRRLNLAVGLGTFRPWKGDSSQQVMHQEPYAVPEATWEACARARRVLAVGTTTVRALETVARTGELEGRTGLFIRGDYDFGVVDLLMTNFHQPRSTLLLMLEAFAGPRWREIYRIALEEGYRFLSFGDAMLVSRR